MSPASRNGILLISIPKSGTMFFSRCLEKATGLSCIFGLAFRTPSELLAALETRWHPDVRAALADDSPSTKLLATRYSQYMGRHRDAHPSPDHRSRIVSDHGLSSFIEFIANPSFDNIQKPGDLVEHARENGLQLVFLHRDIKAVANSLVRFLVDGKSRLVKLRDAATAASLVCELYAPVLAEQMRRWARLLPRPDVISLRFEDVVADPAPALSRVCLAGSLPGAHIEGLTADSQRSWTYRSDQRPRWPDTFSAQQQATLQALQESIHE